MTRHDFFADRRHKDPDLKGKVFAEAFFAAFTWPLWVFLLAMLGIFVGLFLVLEFLLTYSRKPAVRP